VGSSTLYDGTQTATTTAAALNSGTSRSCSSVLVQNDPDSTQDVFVGNDSSQSVQLVPGQAEVIPVDNVNKVFVKTASGTATVNWHAGSV